MASLEQYGIFVVAILIGGGFAFGGIASYAGLTPSGDSGDRERVNLSLPAQQYTESAYDRGLRVQGAIAQRNDVVFVNAFYDNQSQKEQLQNLQPLSQSFNNRVYVSVANSSSNSDLMISYGLVDFPAAVVIGARGSQQVENVTVSGVSEAICGSFQSIDGATRCL